MEHYKELAINELHAISEGNAAGNTAIIGLVGGSKGGIKFCKVLPFPPIKGVCTTEFTA
ncbi:bacteriocin [Streptococcus halichoeri]|uniref:bacteriocin n=1 Tax=Streptococcus halichoeri TaxID=254785 RepID=UPI00135C100A|nr:bacteriocin [Streptococcus halichoeri]